MQTQIQYTNVPGTYVQFDETFAVRGLTGMPRSVNVFAPMTANASGTAGQRTLAISAGQAQSALGRKSIGAQMVATALAVPSQVPVYFIPVADAAGTAAQYTLTVTDNGNDKDNGLLRLNITGTELRVEVAQHSASTVAENIANAINASTQPFSAAPSNGDVVITLNHEGELGNGLHISASGSNAYLSYAVTQTQQGAGNPLLQPLLANYPQTQLTKIVSPYSDQANIDALRSELAHRWDYQNQRDGRLFYGNTATLENALLAITETHRANSAQIVEVLAIGSASAPWAVAAEATANIELQAATDTAIPYRMELDGISAPADHQVPNDSQLNQLIGAGYTVAMPNGAGNMQLVKTVTTYTTDSSGATANPDLQILEKVETVSFWRWHQNNQFNAQYIGKFKIGKDADGEPGPRTLTESKMHTILVEHYREFVDAELMTNIEQYAKQTKVEIGQGGDRFDTIQHINPIEQLNVIATTAALRNN